MRNWPRRNHRAHMHIRKARSWRHAQIEMRGREIVNRRWPGMNLKRRLRGGFCETTFNFQRPREMRAPSAVGRMRSFFLHRPIRLVATTKSAKCAKVGNAKRRMHRLICTHTLSMTHRQRCVFSAGGIKAERSRDERGRPPNRFDRDAPGMGAASYMNLACPWNCDNARGWTP
jgi:hypothetical protein